MVHQAAGLRRAADIEQLRALERETGARVRLVDAPTQPGRPLRLQVDVRAPASAGFPGDATRGVGLRIETPARYPFERPVVKVETRVFHPNVFANGVVCLGERWLPSEGMDLFVRRVLRLLCYEPAHVNPRSAANAEAATWYLKALARSPGLFPTDRLLAPVAVPGPAPTDTPRVVVTCPACGKGLRLPAGRRGQVACPACHREFEART